MVEDVVAVGWVVGAVSGIVAATVVVVVVSSPQVARTSRSATPRPRYFTDVFPSPSLERSTMRVWGCPRLSDPPD